MQKNIQIPTQIDNLTTNWTPSPICFCSSSANCRLGLLTFITLCCSKTLDSFRKGEIDVLISSDAIARGTDVEGMRNVINYDMAQYVKTYIHRAGRTARAGHSGQCFSILRKSEV